EKFGRNKSIDELTTEIAESGERVRHDLRGLQYELDFHAKFLMTFRKQTVSWISAAAAVGEMVALPPMRKKMIYFEAESARKSQKKLVETGFAVAVLKIAVNMVRTVIVEFVKNRLAGLPGQSRRKT